MKVSVIISTFKRPDRLKQAIKSVLAQTFQDFEVVVVADGLKDPASKVIAEFNDKRIKYFEIEHFGTDTKPKNTGILESKGQYIAFLDDDNQFRPDHLQALVNELDKTSYVDLVYGDRWIVYEDGQQGQRGRAEDYHFGVLGDHNFIDTSDVLVRREALFAVGGFDERFRKFVDWNLWWRMEKYGFYFKRVPLIITDYHIHDDMKSNRKEDTRGTFIPAWDPVEVEVELPYLGEKTEPKVAIFSLVYDRPEYTKKCFESLYKTAGYPFTHFVVSQTPEDAKFIKKEFPNVHLIENEKNVGISKGSNQALEEIMKPTKVLEVNDSMMVYEHDSKPQYDVVVKVDPDCLLITPDWLKTMVKIYKSNHKIALSCYIQGLRDNPGGAPRVFYGKICDEQVGFSRHLGGICHFVSSKAYEQFRWDENSFLHGEQDLEFSLYLQGRGYAMAYLENCMAEHYEGTQGQQERYPEYFERRKIEKSTRYEKHKST